MPSARSAEVFFHGQLRFLADHGFDLTLVAEAGPVLEAVGRREGVATEGVPVIRAPSLGRDLKLLPKLVALFRRLRPDLVHCDMPKAAILGGPAARLAGVPRQIYTLHGIRADGYPERGWKRATILAMERVACACPDSVMCVSDSVRRRIVQLGVVDPTKVRLIGAHGTINGIDVPRFRRTEEVDRRTARLRASLGLPEGARVVGYVGRLVRDKGLVELVEAFDRLHRRDPNLHLLMAGQPALHNALPAATTRSIERHPAIHATGRLDDVIPAYHLCEFLVLPTYREGLPYCPLEAAACGLPTVATEVTGCIDAIEQGVTGLLVPPKNVDALARAMTRYLDNPDLRRAHGEAAHRSVEKKYRPRDVQQAILDEYRRLLHLPAPNR